ncbi:hypothetical protein X970_11990 [Pseudomonas monteilii SB3101]|uniref:Uncharacterized protein n=1 Tax=Pseudomonas monteilii SB3101 TaxID=1435058 RepID=V9V8R0_9PSED|nr:hypothetical protein [Pseudomonas monteilii]AHC85742.1 hypothetical protein X969_12345 [Pseudomonas monteilii SB3078]AHC91102.1 hypothetical protein X970_11990 [Pseudomonas monteilii SB3101]
MSLESQIADLVSSSNALIAYFNGKKGAIDSAVAAAIAAVPETTRSWYVDQANGLDTNAGTQAAPFRTLEKAINSTPRSGLCLILLMGDYDLRTVPVASCATVRITGLVVNGVRPKFRPAYIPTLDANGAITANVMAGFSLPLGNITISLRYLDLVLPTSDGVTPAPSTSSSGALIRASSTTDRPVTLNVVFEQMNVTKGSGWAGSLIGVSNVTAIFACSTSTFPSDFAGRYVSDVAAGTLTKDLGNFISNLVSL